MLVKYVNKSVSKWVLPSVSEFNRPWAIPAVSQQFQQLFNERAKPSVRKQEQLSPSHARAGVAALFLVTKKNWGGNLKKAYTCVKKPGESNRDVFRALQWCG